MPPPQIPRWAGWLIPDLALALTIFTLLYALLFYRAPEQLFRDSDTGWHIRTGERILDRSAVPRVDEYSFSKPAQPWFAWEWLADTAMGAAHRSLGLRGVVLLYLTAIGLCTWFWVRLHWAAGSNFFLVCVLASPMLTTVQLHWLARPHVFGWVLLLAALLLLEQGRLRPWIAAVLAAVWVNVHGSFFLLPLLAVLYRSSWQTIAAASLVTFLNPYGWHLHTHLWHYLRDTELLQRVAEFQSFNFHAPGAWQVAAALLVAMIGFVCAGALGQWSRALTLLLFCAVGLRSARGLPVLALAALPLAAGAMAAAWDRWPLAPKGLRAALDYGNRLQRLQNPLRGYATGAVLAALVALSAIGSPTGFPEKEFPVAAAPRLPDGGKLLAPDKFGGYLIYRFNGNRKVFFDGRSDYYGSSFMKEYVDLVEVRPGWEKIIEKYGFTHALLPPRYSLLAALEKAGWKRTYTDSTSVLLERNF